MRIEIIPRERDDETTSFDLEINGVKKIEDTGLSNACSFLMSNFGKFCREDSEVSGKVNNK